MPDYNYIQRVYKIYEHVTNTIVQRLPKKLLMLLSTYLKNIKYDGRAM